MHWGEPLKAAVCEKSSFQIQIRDQEALLAVVVLPPIAMVTGRVVAVAVGDG